MVPLGVVSVMLLVTLFLSIYFIPTIIALSKKHFQKTAIILTNIFLGWTYIGWVVALVWSVMKERNFN